MKKIAFKLELANIYEAYEPGKHIVTRDGRPVSVVCTNLSGNFPFVGKYTTSNGDEIAIQTSKEGLCSLIPNCQDDDDLFLLVEEPKFEIGDTIRSKDGGVPITIKDIDDLYYRFENDYIVSIRSQDDWEIVDPSEKELTEFENMLKTVVNSFCQRTEEPAGAEYMTEEGAKNASEQLLLIARKQLEKNLPHWKKCEEDPRHSGVFRQHVGYFEYMGYEINREEIFEKLPKED